MISIALRGARRGALGRFRRPHKEVDHVFLPAIDERGDPAAGHKIHTSADQWKSSRAQILHGGRKVELAVEPWLHRVLIGGSDIHQVIGHQRADVTRPEFRDQPIIGLTSRDLKDENQRDDRNRRGDRPAAKREPRLARCDIALGSRGLRSLCAHPLLQGRWRLETQGIIPQDGAQAGQTPHKLRATGTIGQMLIDFHGGSDVQFPVVIRVEEFLNMLAVHARSPFSGCAERTVCN
jgi:hypothetical protein